MSDRSDDEPDWVLRILLVTVGGGGLLAAAGWLLGSRWLSLSGGAVAALAVLALVPVRKPYEPE